MENNNPRICPICDGEIEEENLDTICFTCLDEIDEETMEDEQETHAY